MPRMLLKQGSVTIGEVIGEGAMGEVFRGTYKGQTVAIKKSKHGTDLDTAVKEFTSHCQLKHDYVLKFIGVLGTTASYSLVLEYAEKGDLKSYLKAHTVPLSVKSKICHDIAHGLNYCHDQNIVHFDLKTENILLTENLTPKISDFGVSSSKMELGLRGNKAGGTIAWVAPERLSKDLAMRNTFKEYPKLSDVYAFGLIMWSVALDGKCPYANQTRDAICKEKNRRDHATRLLSQIPREIHTTYKERVENLLKYEPRDRESLLVTALGLEELYDDEDIYKEVAVTHMTSRVLDLNFLSEDEDNGEDEEDEGNGEDEEDEEDEDNNEVKDGKENSNSDTCVNGSESGRSTLVDVLANEKTVTPKATSNDYEVKRSVLAENKNPATPETNIVQSSYTTPPKEWSSDNLLALVESSYVNGFIKSKAALNVRIKTNGVNAVDIFAEFEYLARKSTRHKFAVGWFHEIGLGTERDNTKAFECYKEAAEKDNMHAAYKLGLCYYNDYDLENARKWLAKASTDGHQKAKEKYIDYFKSVPSSVFL
ncbi:9146_t:CDS:2 [Paraglomus occultum]|uniref:9146_t:CDS:1 n=1 Tax=Paraglomus occultum TaxID=144539 RepID=A0A9N8WIV6_9GLOM|nr:9146_t:CDS:2 [Paraglomus occultum]